MKAIILKKNGGTEVLELKEIQLNKPKKNEVLIEHVAIGLNYIDVYHRTGIYPVDLPSGIGLEASGIIREVGSDVRKFFVGDKVAYAAAPLGSYATHRLYPAKNIVKIPNNIDLDIAACIMTKGLTSFYLLHKTYPGSSGESILFHAAAGGIGQVFCQWAKSLGCKVFGTVGSDEKIKLAKKYGCSEVINYTKEDFSKRILEITDGRGVSVVFDGVGKSTFEKSIKCLQTRGMMVSFGNSSGVIAPINVFKTLQPKGLFFTRPSMAQYLRNSKELKEASDILFKKIQLRKIIIEIFKKYSLNDAAKAHQDLEGRIITGPAILKP